MAWHWDVDKAEFVQRVDPIEEIGWLDVKESSQTFPFDSEKARRQIQELAKVEHKTTHVRAVLDLPVIRNGETVTVIWDSESGPISQHNPPFFDVEKAKKIVAELGCVIKTDPPPERMNLNGVEGWGVWVDWSENTTENTISTPLESPAQRLERERKARGRKLDNELFAVQWRRDV